LLGLDYYIELAKQESEFEAKTKFLINTIKLDSKFGINIATAIVNQNPSLPNPGSQP
jgi:hypothetical protein